jgi:tetratricopeptide (TPR) repeat protein
MSELEQAYAELVSAFPDESPETLTLLAKLQAAVEVGDSATMLDCTQQLLASDLQRTHDVIHLLRGDAFTEQNDYAAAAEQYRLAIAHGADDASLAWFKLGNALAALRQPAEAVLALGRAVELEPGHPAIWLQLGYALLELKQFPDAAIAFTNAQALTGGEKGHYGMAWLHHARAPMEECTESKLAAASAGLRELREAIRHNEIGPEAEQLGAVQALLTDWQEPDFPFWHCWINPAFELARGTDLLQPPASQAWAELVMWPRDVTGNFRILRDVLLELPEWGS